MADQVTARAAGRINVIGEHTDYTGGLALAAAIQQGTTIQVRRRGQSVILVSDQETEPAVIPLTVSEVGSLTPAWARYPAAVVAEMQPKSGAVGTVVSDLPVGAGLSSSAALTIATALALGFDGDDKQLAQLCQRAEHLASGVPCGMLDQLAVASGVSDALVMIDCTSLAVSPVPFPRHLKLVGVHSGERRRLASTAYGLRRAQCFQAQEIIGPLREATVRDVETIADQLLRRRARHVVTENARVLEFVKAVQDQRYDIAGDLMNASHTSLRDDFEVTTPALDRLADELRRVPGVYGARMTGGGFGGVVIALCDQSTEFPAGHGASTYRPSSGIQVMTNAGDRRE